MQLLPSLLIAESPWRGLFQASQSRDSPTLGPGRRRRTAAARLGEELAWPEPAELPRPRPTSGSAKVLCHTHCPKSALLWCPGLCFHASLSLMGQVASGCLDQSFPGSQRVPRGGSGAAMVRATKRSSGRELCSELCSAPASEPETQRPEGVYSRGLCSTSAISPTPSMPTFFPMDTAKPPLSTSPTAASGQIQGQVASYFSTALDCWSLFLLGMLYSCGF